MKEAGYRHVRALGYGEHELEEIATGKREIWAASPHFAGYAIKYKNTLLEFCRSV